MAGRQPQQPSPQQRPPAVQPRRRRGAVILGIGAVICAAIVAAAIAHDRSQQPASTVTFVTTGSPADVTWGDAGSSAKGAVPMRETIPIGNPLYYSLNVQLNGDGSASCQILIGGTVISQATATGGYTIARCQVSKDASGQWRDDTSGG